MGFFELESQYDDLAKYIEVNNLKSKYRYGNVFRRFLRFLTYKYNLSSLCDISQEHILEYVRHMQDYGYATATIKLQLIDLNFLHNNIAYTRKTFPAYNNLNLRCRTLGNYDKRWTDYEFNMMCNKSHKFDKYYYQIIILVRYAGLYLEECFKITNNDAKNACCDNKLCVKDKNGLVRYVPLNYKTLWIFQKNAYEQADKNFFLGSDTNIDCAMEDLQQFIVEERRNFTNAEITLDGLRYNYALEQYSKHIGKGLLDFESRKTVADYLGNRNDALTRIYLSDNK